MTTREPSAPAMRYVVVTAARNEEANLPRLATSLRAQETPPSAWWIVENGSSDATLATAQALAGETAWIHVLSLPEAGARERGAPIVRALEAALACVTEDPPEVLVNVDADVSFEPDFFSRLVATFVDDPDLGIAGGSCWEQQDGAWRQRFVTGGTVWGATRAYRWACLQDVLPLEHRHGWDGIDQIRARSRGWRTETMLDLPFLHHRAEGAGDASTWRHWVQNGETAHFMGYRPSYLLLRTAHQCRRDPRALGLLWGFLGSSLSRAPRLADKGARRVLRDDQRWRELVRRKDEASGRPAG